MARPKKPTLRDLRFRIQAYRGDGFSQHDMADFLKVSIATYNKMEMRPYNERKYKPHDSTKARIVRRLKEIEYLKIEAPEQINWG